MSSYSVYIQIIKVVALLAVIVFLIASGIAYKVLQILLGAAVFIFILPIVFAIMAAINRY